MTQTTITNNPNQAGQLASRKSFFGENSRYAVAAVYTRLDGIQWFVWDAERTDDEGNATVIRQESTKEAAVSGL